MKLSRPYLTRLVRLMELQEEGALENKTLQEIADMLPDKPSRATVMRNLRDIEKYRSDLEKLRKL